MVLASMRLAAKMARKYSRTCKLADLQEMEVCLHDRFWSMAYSNSVFNEERWGVDFI